MGAGRGQTQAESRLSEREDNIPKTRSGGGGGRTAQLYLENGVFFTGKDTWRLQGRNFSTYYRWRGGQEPAQKTVTREKKVCRAGGLNGDRFTATTGRRKKNN